MGQVSKRVHAKLKKTAASLNLPTGKMRGRADMPSVEAWIKDGMDPIHAAYAFVQHITSRFAEGASQLPEMKAYAKVVGAAEGEYMPSGPPMSPLTGSFFTTWAFYDLRFDGTDTIASCQIEANDVICMNPDQLDALKKLGESRMGVYEHVGMDGSHVRLRELVTNDEFTCHCASGYRGRTGELWYVRLLPPLLPDLARYHIVFTTPYLLTQASKEDWIQFLQRGMMQFKSGDERQALYRLLKYGPEPNYWNEFVFQAYHHPQSDAIFLAGYRISRRRYPMRDTGGNLKLGKGSAFVKSRLKYLRQEDDTWEADFFPIPCSGGRYDSVWMGMVLSHGHDYVLAQRTFEEPPTVNDLARLLADAMQRPMAERIHRPRCLYLRAKPEWSELLPHLKQIGIKVVAQDTLPKWDQAFGDLYAQVEQARAAQASARRRGASSKRRKEQHAE